MLCILADIGDIPSIFLIAWSARTVSNHTVSSPRYIKRGMNHLTTLYMRKRHFAAREMSGVHITGAHVTLQRYSQKKVEKIHSTLMGQSCWQSLSRSDAGSLGGPPFWSGHTRGRGTGTAAGVGGGRDWSCMVRKNAFWSCLN